jgi:hypothetical protein
VACNVREAKDGKGKGFWTRIGAAWPHEDGEGFNLQIDVLPIDEREIQEGLAIVEKPLSDRTVRTGEEELFKARAKERGPI